MFPTFYISGGAGGDELFGEVVMLLRGEGADGSTTFTDHSSYGHTPSVVNGSIQMDTAKMRNDRPSIYIDGTSDYLQFANAAEYYMTTQEFTMEAWVWFDAWDPTFGESGGIAQKYQQFGNYPASAWKFYFGGNVANLNFSTWLTGVIGVTVQSAAPPFPTGQWVHVAVCRLNQATIGGPDDQLRMYVNGVRQGTYGIAPGSVFHDNGTEPLIIGGFGNGSVVETMGGWLSEFRWTIGTSRYEADFTPPTADFPMS